jgi:hypothetical protein
MNGSSSIDNHEEEQAEKEAPAWRLDPESSFSDWTIRVIRSLDDENGNDDIGAVSNDESAEQTFYNSIDDSGHRDSSADAKQTPLESVYHVHRVYLASGSRKSEYFQTLFSLTTSTEESLSSTTKLTLPESACKVFPTFLDYMYDLHIDYFECNHGKEVVALAFLADYFGVKKLMLHTKFNIAAVLNLLTVSDICREALLYNIDWIIHDCMKIAALSPRDLLPGAIRRSSTSTTSFPSSDESDDTSSPEFPPALLTMEMLPEAKQIELLKLALSNSLRELGQFKRVPSQWKNNIDDLWATHMPTLLARRGDSNYHLPEQGCGLPFPQNKVCPLFYFDREADRQASPRSHGMVTEESLIRDLMGLQHSESSPDRIQTQPDAYRDT